MASNSRLAIAIHTAGMLAFADHIPVTSKMIAESVDTNPVVIRRIIGSLVKHGIVEVKMGTGGGSTLTRSPKEISLAEIYIALEEGEIFHIPKLGESHLCAVGKLIRPVLQKVLGEAENGMIEELKKKTLYEVMHSVREKLPAEFCLKKKND